MKAGLLAVTIFLLSLPAVASACMPDLAAVDRPKPPPHAEGIAARLFAQAASVQVVKVTQTQALSLQEFFRLNRVPWNADVAGWANPVLRTYEVSERLKGAAPVHFNMAGEMQGYDIALPPPGSRYKRPKPWEQSGRFTFDTKRGAETLTILELTPENMTWAICQTYIYGLAGQDFLVFLDAKNHLLREDGPVFSYIRTPNDPWLEVVRKVARPTSTPGPK